MAQIAQMAQMSQDQGHPSLLGHLGQMGNLTLPRVDVKLDFWQVRTSKTLKRPILTPGRNNLFFRGLF